MQPSTFTIISCGARKEVHVTRASLLYTGPLFVKQLEYARTIAPDSHIRILSAKHGLMRLHRLFAPYDQRFTGRHVNIEWAETVQHQWRQWRQVRSCVNDLPITLLAGDLYAHHLSAALTPILGEAPQFIRPLQHMGLGYQLQWLIKQTRREVAFPSLESLVDLDYSGAPFAGASYA